MVDAYIAINRSDILCGFYFITLPQIKKDYAKWKARNMFSVFLTCFDFLVLFLIHNLGQFIDDDVYAYDDNTVGI